MKNRQSESVWSGILYGIWAHSLKLAFLAGVFLFLAACGIGKEPGKSTSGILSFEDERPSSISEEKWRTVPTTPGHKVHVSELDLKCSDCHDETDYSLSPSPEKCLSCHVEEKYLGAPLSKNHCIACHIFRTQKAGYELIPERKDCQTCHTDEMQESINRDFFVDNAPMAIACQSCHKPHDPQHHIDSSECTACHAIYKPGELKNPGHESCMQCHTPHNWKNEATNEFCTKCHTQLSSVMEHNFPFHPQECTTCHTPHLKPAFTSGQCQDCHDDKWQYATAGAPEKHKECTICHSTVDWSFSGTGKCTSCHAREIYGSNNTPAGVPAAHKRCLTCHPEHTWYAQKETASCSSCHGDIARETTIHKKKNCTICHSTHNPGFKGFDTCAACHHNPVENSEGIDTKADCSFCHNPHSWKIKLPEPTSDDVATILDLSIEEVEEKQAQGEVLDYTDDQLTAMHTIQSSKYCGKCHPDIRESGLTTKDDLKADCALCHADHKWRPDDDLCINCHSSIGKDSEEAGMAVCATCHADHTWSPSAPDACRMCHPEQVEWGLATSGEIKADCLMCHSPHTWTSSLECAMCHSDVAAETEGSAHVSCSFCHTDHSWKVDFENTCAKCHPSEVESSKKTAMSNCTMCHSSHAFSADSSEIPACTTCHPAAKPESESSIKNNCSMCHPTHEWKPDSESCATCHSDMSDKGLHRISAHTSCNLCHGDHKWRAVPTDSCTMCHGDKSEDHYPDQSCIECHWFR